MRAVPGDVPALPWRYRPLGARLTVGVMAPVLVCTLGLVFWSMPARVRDQFSALQSATLLLVLAVALVALWGVFRTVVRADERGLTIVNVYRVRRLEWAQVLTVGLRPGDPWAVLDVDDGTVVKVMAIQGSDGARARRATRQLRALVDQRTVTSRDD
ncbi:MAG: PH domain-containing protein [Actinomycetota bacterium]|nr:PH domain-containing protein [Actinomycetota bacterium]